MYASRLYRHRKSRSGESFIEHDQQSNDKCNTYVNHGLRKRTTILSDGFTQIEYTTMDGNPAVFGCVVRSDLVRCVKAPFSAMSRHCYEDTLLQFEGSILGYYRHFY